MLKCKGAVKLMSSDEQMSWKTQLSLHLHLLICRSCRRYKKQLQIISEAFKKLIKSNAKNISEQELEQLRADIIKKYSSK